MTNYSNQPRQSGAYDAVHYQQEYKHFLDRFTREIRQLKPITDNNLYNFLRMNYIVRWNMLIENIHSHDSADTVQLKVQQVRDEYNYIRQYFVEELPVFSRSNDLLIDTELSLHLERNLPRHTRR